MKSFITIIMLASCSYDPNVAEAKEASQYQMKCENVSSRHQRCENKEVVCYTNYFAEQMTCFKRKELK